MKHMSIKEIAAACGGTYHGDKSRLGQEVSSVVIDSRKVEKDSLFIAIKGARVDGHTFIPQVMAAGALCAVAESDLGETDYPYIRVESCTAALKAIAEHYRRSLYIKVVGISGSVGKTSTKEMVASVLNQKYNVLKTAGNFNNEIGLPLTIFNIREEHEVAVLEMGISDFGEMTRLAKMARPDICIITNIGCAHLEQLKDRDGILRAKTEMFTYMNPEGKILFNGDDDKLRGFVPGNGIAPTYFGLDDSCPFHAEEIDNQGLAGTTAAFVTPASRFRAHISIPGDHMVYNALAGIAAGYALGMTDEEIIAGIEALVPLAGRNNLIRTGQLDIIDDCYNANPASMKSSLDVLKKADTRTVAILGDMFELGDNGEQMHYEVGQYAAEIGTDVLICIGSLCSSMAKGAEDMNSVKKEKIAHSSGKACAVAAVTAICYYETKEEFLENIGQILKLHDTVLVKASHGMHFAGIVDILKEMTF